MPRGVMDEKQHISTCSDGCFQGTAYVPVHELQTISSTGGHWSNRLSSYFAIDAALAIALSGHLRRVGDSRQHLQGR
jgi:hypothetical protein